MSQAIKEVIDPILDGASVTKERFRAIGIYLLSHGVIMREESPVEKALYDEARRIDDMLYDYFSVLGLTLHHDVNQEVIRLYPPGATVAGVTMVEESGEGTASIRARVSTDVVAATLALRCLYEERLQRGTIDSNGEAVVTLEDLSACMNTQLRRPLPTNATDKQAILADLRRLRVIRLSPTFLVQDPEAYIAVRPEVLYLVNNEALENALAGQAEAAEATDASQPIAGADGTIETTVNAEEALAA